MQHIFLIYSASVNQAGNRSGRHHIRMTSVIFRANRSARISQPSSDGELTNDLLQLREYQPGDRIKDIHWKMTAKTDELMVKEYDRARDLYYLILQNREDEAKTAFYEESKQYFEERFAGVEWSCYPKTDHESRENEMGELFAPIGIEQPQMKAMERRYRISRNEFFIAVAALAMSIYNKKNDIKLSWIYNGREDMLAMNSVGLLFRDLPVGVRLKEETTLRELFADVHEQVQKGIEHSCYPYVDIHNQAGGSEAAYLLYQQDIRDMGGFEGMDVETIDIRQNQAASQTMLDMEILDGADGLVLMIDYTASLYDDESMETFKDIFVRVAQGLVTYDSQTDITISELRKAYANKGVFRRKK